MDPIAGLIGIIVILLTSLYRIAHWQCNDDPCGTARKAYQRGLEELSKWTEEQEKK